VNHHFLYFCDISKLLSTDVLQLYQFGDMLEHVFLSLHDDDGLNVDVPDDGFTGGIPKNLLKENDENSDDNDIDANDDIANEDIANFDEDQLKVLFEEAMAAEDTKCKDDNDENNEDEEDEKNDENDNDNEDDEDEDEDENENDNDNAEDNNVDTNDNEDDNDNGDDDDDDDEDNDNDDDNDNDEENIDEDIMNESNSAKKEKKSHKKNQNMMAEDDIEEEKDNDDDDDDNEDIHELFNSQIGQSKNLTWNVRTGFMEEKSSRYLCIKRIYLQWKNAICYRTFHSILGIFNVFMGISK